MRSHKISSEKLSELGGKFAGTFGSKSLPYEKLVGSSSLHMEKAVKQEVEILSTIKTDGKES